MRMDLCFSDEAYSSHILLLLQLDLSRGDQGARDALDNETEEF